MNLKNDYFLLYHGKNAQEIQSISLSSNLEEYYPILSLVLTIRKNSFHTIVKLNSFRELLSHIYNKDINGLDELYPLQNSILAYLEQGTDYSVDVLISHIEYLKEKEIIPLENYNRLLSLFEHLIVSKPVEKIEKLVITKESPKNFQERREKLLSSIDSLESFFSHKLLQESLKNLKEYLNTQKFSIGITGVINSGKSTMLNALIGKEILGSSVVPETANLTIIKYAKPSAEVFYWNKEEWRSIVKSSQNVNSIKTFVEETQKLFALELDEYIKQESVSEIIAVEDISKYTSVKQSLGKCNLVKYVNLYYDLDFLQDGIEIVDTPGLDDPVVQREEITKEYLSRCDLMLHLMNVNQSATHKDIEFIVDAILYQHISKVLIVLTQIDSVTAKEVEEVVIYTKKSIKEELKKLNKGSKIDYILEHIDFIPISAKVALSHKLDCKNSHSQVMSLQESGIEELENYLEETLFGKNSSRSELIIRSSSTKLEEYIDRQIHLYKYELEVLSQSKDELEVELLKKQKNRENFISLISVDIDIYKDESIEYVEKLDNFLQEAFIDLKALIHQRVYSDISYTYTTAKKFPEEQRIELIARTAIKDGIVDIIRDYSYKLFKKEELIFANFEKKFMMFNSKDEAVVFHSLDIKESFDKTFQSGLMTFSIEILLEKILIDIQNTKASKYENLNKSLVIIIDNELNGIIDTLSIKIKKDAKTLLDELYATLLIDVKDMEDEFLEEEYLISSKLHGDKDSILEDDITLLKKVKSLENIKAEVSL